jgi:hypothetical protein
MWRQWIDSGIIVWLGTVVFLCSQWEEVFPPIDTSQEAFDKIETA